jgi:hypothetical protein
MTEHCHHCGSRLCNHGNCPECNPCKHCNGGNREDKFFGYENETDQYLDERRMRQGY